MFTFFTTFTATSRFRPHTREADEDTGALYSHPASRNNGTILFAMVFLGFPLYSVGL